MTCTDDIDLVITGFHQWAKGGWLSTRGGHL